jgi:hypothetical protein
MFATFRLRSHVVSLLRLRRHHLSFAVHSAFVPAIDRKQDLLNRV